MLLCPGQSALDLESFCVRSVWSAFVPSAFAILLVLSITLSSIPFIRKLLPSLPKNIKGFITLEEAEILIHPDLVDAGELENIKDRKDKPSIWHSSLISLASVAEATTWIVLGLMALIHNRRQWEDWRSFLMAIPWIFTALRPYIRPTATPPYDVFWLLIVQLLASTLWFGGYLYDNYVWGISLPDTIVLVGGVVNLLTILFVFGVITSMPLAIPGKGIDKEKIGSSISPEDYTPLWRWITFEWVYPLIRRGTSTTLNEPDVWDLSPTMQCRAVFHQFSRIHRSTLVRRLWAANAKDLLIDASLTFLSVSFNYTGPIFLKKILDSLDSTESSQRQISQAYIFAALTFFASVCKAQADVQHLWYGRRACTRLRSSLMSSIYEKALKRKDLSGAIDAKEKEAPATASAASGKGQNGTAKSSSKDKDKDKKEAASEKEKSGADVGKIVQLMSGDANRVAMLCSGIYFLYGAPFEILFAMLLLYRLLGISAFAGVLVLLFGSPTNNFLMRRAVKIQKGVLAARDKRMGVLNEMIAGVKFIKFFAWESKWIGRANEARASEIKWLIKARLNGIMFGLLWSSIPILVAIASFTSYVLLGNQLSVSIAFTSIALFQMLRAPLNVIPSWIVIILQTKVALDRIEGFLNEPEVTDQISSLKKEVVPTSDTEMAPIGISNASFRWNTSEKKPEAETKPKVSFFKRIIPFRKKAADPAKEAQSTTTEEIRFELRNIDVVFPNGEMTVVTGPTASGKTALLMALLGEMTQQPSPPGHILLDKNPLKKSAHGYGQYVSYAAQSPWLQHSSIKENILFGLPMDEKRYDDVLECCALKPDLAIFEDGDKTEIGARGVSLSGGQKARVALARAVYAQSQYVLLDDPLSAVDSHTARLLFDKLLQGPLLANRTVILVTHHVELVLPGTYYLVRMLDGRIDEQGLVKDLREAGKLQYITHDAEAEVKTEQALEELQTATADEAAKKVDSLPEDADTKKPRKLVQDEQREEGAVKWKVYLTYLKASSYWTWAILCCFIVLQQSNGVVEKLWIKVWGEAYNDRTSFLPSFSLFQAGFESDIDKTFLHQSLGHVHQVTHSLNFSYDPIRVMKTPWNMPSPNEHPMYYVGIYSAIGLLSTTLTVSSSFVQVTGGLKASRRLFRRLLDSVMFATIRFHDTTPAGRLLNRFSKDIETIDSGLASSLQQVNMTLASFFASLITVAVIFPWFLLPATIIGFAYFKLGIGYLNTGRDLRRMESNSRSPIFSGFAELLDGIVTVRAFSAERQFLNNLFGKIDLTTRMWYTFWMTNRWLLLHYDFFGALSVLVTTVLALTGRVPAGFAGLTITSAMAFTTSIYWTCRFWTQLELDLNSVERVVEYLELPQQPELVIESNRPPAYWPSSSNEHEMLSVEKLVVKYSPELPAVLHGVSFSLKGRERVGLLGRTGSGKSTLAMSILRFIDPAEGTILIDGIDITKIGLHDLRSRLTFIPQDATLFSGSIRDNLDPFGDYTDAECLDVLYRVHLLSHSAHASQRSSRAPSIHEVDTDREEGSNSGTSTAVQSSSPVEEPDEERVTVTLDTKVSSGGLNFSQGQRQLIALARALLRQSSLVIMDEATSSIDFKTDAKIQATIRDEFKNSLLLTVAHRLRTVIDYDRLIVLDQGRIVEFDTPYTLIQKEGGLFRNMCLKSGTFQELEAAARAKAESSS